MDLSPFAGSICVACGPMLISIQTVAEAMPPDQGVSPQITKTEALTKSKIWPTPNYRRMVLDGYAPAKVRILRWLYEWLPSKPRTALPRQQLYFEQAVNIFRQSSEAWLAQDRTSNQAIKSGDFRSALRSVLHRGWHEDLSDLGYWRSRYERSDRGCQLHVILGADYPYKRVPNHKQFELIQRQMAKGWPVPRPAHESKGFYVLDSDSISLESGAGFVRARWSESSANDRGYFMLFDDMQEASDWLAGLSSFLVMTEKNGTRLVAHCTTHEAATALARDASSPLSYPQALSTSR